MLWDTLIANFTLPKLETAELTQAMTLKVKHWALKKMAEQFKNFKKTLYSNYVRKEKTSRISKAQ